MSYVSVEQILANAGIAYKATRTGSYSTECPQCDKGYLSVKCDAKGAVWHCQGCEFEGGGYCDQPDKRDAGAIDFANPKAIYDYVDESGVLLFQVVRFETSQGIKKFLQRRAPDSKSWKLDGVRRVPFMLPELIEDVALDHEIFIVEGEKDVLNLRKRGVPATTNPQGAGKWRPEFNTHLAGANAVIIADNDDVGRAHAAQVAGQLRGVARRVRVLDLAQFWPEAETSNDVSDWFARGQGTVERLNEIVAGLPDWTPAANGLDHASNGAGPREEAPIAGAAAPVKITRLSPDELLLSAWLVRKLPPRDFLLGDVFSTTSRWLIFGDTGVGKTLFSLDLAGALAAGVGFLDWQGSRPARVMYLDGEMPGELFKERMELVAAQFGPDIALFGYNREVLALGKMPPLNTPEGEAWLFHEIELVQPDAIIFDSIMSLLAGVMGEEESWAPFKLTLRAISIKHIGSITIHHTGHDTSRSFGTKTREWEMEAVASLIEELDKSGIRLTFQKHRLMTPKTARQFRQRVIVRGDGGWTDSGAETVVDKPKGKTVVAMLATAILRAYDRMADEPSALVSTGQDGKTVRKVSVETLREQLKSGGLLEKDAKGNLTALARKYFQRAKLELLTPPNVRLFEERDLIWK